MEQIMTTREVAANACLDVLDTKFFTALCEPARVAIIRALVLKGRSDIQTLAEDFPQDRSVIARHLKIMEGAELVRSDKVGRQQFYELNGTAILTKMETMTSFMQTIMPECCP
jgi:DNA-binding transcriptional ArsR family regulator